ncbi:MAG: type II toxin-antitoxin system RatA family toxin [Alphaproteobacteria bacterium]
MPIYQEKRIIRYSAQQMYNLVADVEKYPEFLPWVQSAKEADRMDNQAVYYLEVGFGPIKERFSTRDVFTPYEHIEVYLNNGPLSKLENHWYFKDVEEGGCEVSFTIDFEFKSKLLTNVMNGLFYKATQMMVKSFEERAKKVYSLHI